MSTSIQVTIFFPLEVRLGLKKMRWHDSHSCLLSMVVVSARVGKKKKEKFSAFISSIPTPSSCLDLPLDQISVYIAQSDDCYSMQNCNDTLQ